MRTIKISFSSILAALLVLLFAMAASAATTGDKAGDAAKAKQLNFSKEPVAYMAEIYKNYHDWKVDQGIESTKNALTAVDKLYKKDVNARINDPKLKRNRAFEIKSTLHTLLGMLYYRKALMVVADQKKSMAPFMDKIDKKQELSEKDLEKLNESLKKSKASGDMKKYHDASITEFRTAIQADPASPAPHFQLGTVLNPMMAGVQSAEAEKEFFTAAKLSLAEGDVRSAERAAEALKSLNPKSGYLTQIEKLMKGKNHAN